MTFGGIFDDWAEKCLKTIVDLPPSINNFSTDAGDGNCHVQVDSNGRNRTCEENKTLWECIIYKHYK